MTLSELVSVVVCVRNREGMVGDALRSIIINNPGEVIVIDDRSSDRSGEVARQFTARVYRSEGKGLAAARQQGADLSRGPYVAFIDSDITLSEGCLESMAAFLEEHEDHAVAQAQIINQSNSYWARETLFRDALRRQESTPSERRGGAGGAVAFRRDVLLEHGYDPFFTGAGEDIDLARRIRQAGWRFHVVDQVAYHRSRASLKALIEQQIWYGRGQVRLRLKALPSSRAASSRGESSHRGVAWLKLLLRHRRFDVLPIVIVSAAAHYVGEAAELLTMQLASRRIKGSPGSEKKRNS